MIRIRVMHLCQMSDIKEEQLWSPSDNCKIRDKPSAAYEEGDDHLDLVLVLILSFIAWYPAVPRCWAKLYS
jgi:hypothetical protein